MEGSLSVFESRVLATFEVNSLVAAFLVGAGAVSGSVAASMTTAAGSPVSLLPPSYQELTATIGRTRGAPAERVGMFAAGDSSSPGNEARASKSESGHLSLTEVESNAIAKGQAE